VTKEGLPDAGKQDLMSNLLFMVNQFTTVAAMYIILLNILLASIVVWNPWDKKAKAMQILGMQNTRACCVWSLQLLRGLLL